MTDTQTSDQAGIRLKEIAKCPASCEVRTVYTEDGAYDCLKVAHNDRWYDLKITDKWDVWADAVRQWEDVAPLLHAPHRADPFLSDWPVF